MRISVRSVGCVTLVALLATSAGGADTAAGTPAPAGEPRSKPRSSKQKKDEQAGRRWKRWAAVGAGVAAAGVATYVVLTRNRPPTAGTIGVSSEGRGMAGVTTFTLTAVEARDPDGDTLRYTWDLGDGLRADGPQVTHVYASPGTYTISLAVDDGGPPVSAPPTTVLVERSLSGRWSGGYALPMMNPLRLELIHDTTGLAGTFVAEPYRGTAGGTSRLEGRVEAQSYPCRVTWSTVLLGVVTVRFEGSVASAEGGVMTGTIAVDQPGEFSQTGTTTFRR